jgi:dihydrofolate reductase
MKRFKEVTQGHPVVMGRKTHESIGKKLEGRDNIIVTTKEDYESPGCKVVHSLEKALSYAQEIDKEEVFVIGGAKIYEQALPYTAKLYLTVVDEEAEADAYFPEYSEFNNVIKRERGDTEDGIEYKFIELIRDS